MPNASPLTYVCSTNGSKKFCLYAYCKYVFMVQLNSKLTLECRDSRAIFNISRVTH